ncbi:MAG: HlyD family secretion protein, partial [Phycisphaerae bacterium]|nr:HlyD family secretion protein [Phycisphaerae bacterium]
MKKVIVFIVVIGVLIVGYNLLLKVQVVNLLDGKTVTVRRGDLEVPITSSGRIEAATMAQIKSKATGEVIKIFPAVGEIVETGEIIVELDKSDEQRNVERAQADHDRAVIAYDRAEITLKEAETVGKDSAQEELRQAKAQFTMTKIEYDNLKDARTSSPMVVSPKEWDTVTARLESSTATLEGAKLKVRQSETTVLYAKKDLETMKQNVDIAKQLLDEA